MTKINFAIKYMLASVAVMLATLMGVAQAADLAKSWRQKRCRCDGKCLSTSTIS